MGSPRGWRADRAASRGPLSAAAWRDARARLEKEAAQLGARQEIYSRSFNIQAHGGWARAAPSGGFRGRPKLVTLQPGARIDRYGGPGGNFAAPHGTAFERRSLPTGSERLPYHAYIVRRPLPAMAGQAAPAFGKPGLGMQYRFAHPVERLVRDGYLVPLD